MNWSKKLQAQGNSYIREVSSARNFVTDFKGEHWTFGKSVGAAGEYHENGASARKHLVSIGFIDILELSINNKLRRKVINLFREWAYKIDAFNLNGKLDRYLNNVLYIKMRLLIPPNFKYNKK